MRAPHAGAHPARHARGGRGRAGRGRRTGQGDGLTDGMSAKGEARIIPREHGRHLA